MLTFFLTIIIVYVFWLVVRPLVARILRHLFQKKIENIFRNAYGDPQSGPTSDNQRRSRDRKSQRAPRRKIFSADEGEYIEFQEITVETSTTEYDSADTQGSTSRTTTYTSYSSKTYTPREPRISDAEWEELP